MKKAISLLLISLSVLYCILIPASASGDEIYDYETNIGAEIDDVIADEITISAKSAILIDSATGTVLYSKNAGEALPPASVTKIMTLLLVSEAISNELISLEDNVTVSANAASKGGSQIFIKEGEVFTVEELLKSTVIASANDAAVALAEYLSGSEDAFVAAMNKRAEELGLKGTHFENATGLDDTVTNHVMSAYDIAVISKELIKFDFILKYSNVWQDSIRNGEFILTNTNRLVRYYQGCTGLKTGSTDKAGFCISATAKRGNMHLIAVIMGAETRDTRNNEARTLLDFGFSNYTLYEEKSTYIEDVPVIKGEKASIGVFNADFAILVSKADLKKIEKKFNIPESVEAPIKENDAIGKIEFLLDGQKIGECNIIANESVNKINFIYIFGKIINHIIVGFK